MTLTHRAAAILLVGSIIAISIGSSIAQQQGAEETIKARQQHFKDIGKAAKEIGDQLKSGTIDKAVIEARAKEIDAALKGIPSWFPPGSGPESGVKTAAKPEIWAQADDFRKAYETAQAAADKFVPIAAGGDLAATAAGFQEVGHSCGGCHKPFRVKDDSAH